MKEIPLTQGKFAIVDDEDFHFLSNFKWCAVLSNGNFYALRRIKRSGKWTTIKMHTVLMKTPAGLVVDHVNGNSLDNRRVNMRLCSASDNNRNKKNAPGATSKYRGVHWANAAKKWKASISINNRCHYLGIYASEIDAARAYDAAAYKHYGNFSNLNGV